MCGVVELGKRHNRVYIPPSSIMNMQGRITRTQTARQLHARCAKQRERDIHNSMFSQSPARVRRYAVLVRLYRRVKRVRLFMRTRRGVAAPKRVAQLCGYACRAYAAHVTWRRPNGPPHQIGEVRW